MFLTIPGVCAPEIKGLITQHNAEYYLIVFGNEEVKELVLITPIETGHQGQPWFIPDFMTPEWHNRVLSLFLPDYLPEYPKLLFVVNRKEVHMIMPIDLQEIRLRIPKKKEPTRDLGINI